MCEPDPPYTVMNRLRDHVISLIQTIDANERFMVDLSPQQYDLLELKEENSKYIEAIKYKYHLWKIMKELNVKKQ